MKNILTWSSFLAVFLLLATGCGDKGKGKNEPAATNADIEKRVSDLLAQMTQEEKIGQLAQYSNPYEQTGTGEDVKRTESFDDMIRQGLVGSFLNVTGVEATMRLQKIAVEESRLKIPLIFGYDVIHGYKTMFPVPLAEAASFDRTALEKSARIAAIEAAADGIHWTFAPMVDISRDPRWGRIMEGAGEDVFLGAEAAKARVKGFQGTNLADANSIAACAKHFVGYGAAIAGRDYNAADMSDRTLREVYLPPFKAAVDAGVATFMSSFNTVGGVPASGSKYIQTDILRGEWGFEGFVVSDWNSVGEMLAHGNVADPYDAAYRGFDAGVDMDMEGRLYVTHLKKLIEEGKISQAQLDESVRRILRVKFQLGLFDNPFQYCDKEKEKSVPLTAEHLEAAQDVARRSIVLLKNDKNVLPISKDVKTIAVIGPLAADKDAAIANWRAKATPNSAVSLLEGIKTKLPNANVIYAEGTKLVLNEEQNFFTQLDINTTDRSGFAEAVAAAKKADIVVVALGETAYMSGECRSYADISMQGLQTELLKELRKTGKPLVLTLFNGRPMVLTDVVGETDALLECWLLGSKSGDAIADVLFGDYNPSGKLPATFPYHVGQVPIFYEQLNTGRPLYTEASAGFASKYRDVPNAPLFSFGFGLSYTTFEYSGLKISSAKPKFDENITVTATVKNTGNFDGEEVVQLYIRDVIGNGVSRPVLQLKGFEKINLKKGESKEVNFTLTTNDLAFVRLDNSWGAEAGKFQVFVGSASSDLRLNGEFELVEK